jgi:hypothetical protein
MISKTHFAAGLFQPDGGSTHRRGVTIHGNQPGDPSKSARGGASARSR